jgi:signal transduction histidine kinase
MGKQPVVLNIHHDDSARSMNSRMLRGMGLCVQEACSGEQALQLFAVNPPDLILLDAGENGAGLEVCRKLRTSHRYTGPIAVQITRSASSAETSQWVEDGADAFLADPPDEAILTSTVRCLLRIRTAEQDLAEANQNLASVRQDLQRSHDEFQQFALRASHDFQEPLRSIAAFTELMEQKRGGELSEDQKIYLGYVLSGTHRIQRLLDYILRYAQTSHEIPRNYTLVALKNVLDSAIRNRSEVIAGSEASITAADPLPLVWGNFLGLQQVFECLITNSIKYRQPGIPANIRISAEQRSPEEWLVSFEDNGIGIAQQHHQSIFVPFKRLHGRDIPGTGMGLALCRRIIAAHGGKIWVESALGQGAKFLFTLGASAEFQPIR